MTYLSNDFFFVLYVNPFLNVKRVYRSISKTKTSRDSNLQKNNRI